MTQSFQDYGICDYVTHCQTMLSNSVFSCLAQMKLTKM